MTKLQIGTVLGGVVLFLGLYFGFDTKPDPSLKEQAVANTTNETANAGMLLDMAKKQLPEAAAKELAGLESQLDSATAAEKTALMKRISGWWYANGNIPAAGIWAETVAGSEKSDTAWSVAGATFYQALAATTAPFVRQFCAEHAASAFEHADSIRPERVEYRVNLALVYAENPPPDNPMKAVLMLKELESQHPENPAVYNALGRLAIKTGQWQKAVERLEKAYSLDPANPNTPCLLAQAYQGIGNATKAAEFAQKCK